MYLKFHTNLPGANELSGNIGKFGNFRIAPWATWDQCYNMVGKCDPWIHQATQGPAFDGPFGNQKFFRFCKKYFKRESDIYDSSDALMSCVRLYLCLSEKRIPIASFRPF